MGKVNRLKVRSSLTNRILIILLFLVCGSLILFFSFKLINKSYSNLAYEIGSYSLEYKDYILKNYEEYLDLTKLYKIDVELTNENFINNYYLVSFQEYDSCAEKKFKEVEKIEIDKNINITFRVFNKCGWCKAKTALHLIKIDKIDSYEKIKYDYVYNDELQCGTIK